MPQEQKLAQTYATREDMELLNNEQGREEPTNEGRETDHVEPPDDGSKLPDVGSQSHVQHESKQGVESPNDGSNQVGEQELFQDLQQRLDALFGMMANPKSFGEKSSSDATTDDGSKLPDVGSQPHVEHESKKGVESPNDGSNQVGEQELQDLQQRLEALKGMMENPKSFSEKSNSDATTVFEEFRKEHNNEGTSRREHVINVGANQYVPHEVIREMELSIMDELQKRSGWVAPHPFEICIFSAPEKLRKENEDAYSPRVVSIGPIHRGKPHLQPMEAYKWRCLDRYQDRQNFNFYDLIKAAMELENSIRRCYKDTFDHINSQDFAQMIILDSIFIDELLWQNAVHGQDAGIFENQWIISDLLHDIMLLENQLPFFVFPELFSHDASFYYGVTFEYFQKAGTMGALQRFSITDITGRHFLDFLYNCHILGTPTKLPIYRGRVEYTHSATELQKSGVLFRNYGGCLLDLCFKKGILDIPELTVNEWTETFFRNLIAYEQCDGRKSKEITGYIIFMSNLIKTAEDVDLLVNCGIIRNHFGDSKQVANLWKSIYRELTAESNGFYFAELCEEVNEYSRNYWHQMKATWFNWKKILRRDYFSNPWSAISVIAAIVLLILTCIQTGASLVPLF